MTDGVERVISPRYDGEPGEVQSLARTVLNALAGRAPDDAIGVDEGFVSRLCAAVQTLDRAAQHQLLSDMRAAGVADEEIADRYIPVAARRLGLAWCADETGFAEVTIGTARLQAMLRDLPETPVTPAKRGASDSPLVLMIVPEGEHHTLGPVVAAHQLRRAGASVRLCLGQPVPVILDIVETARYDVVMVSSAETEKLERLRRLVLDIRHALQRPTPIVVGGAMMDRADGIRAETGADHAVNDVTEALRLCGLRTSPPGARRHPQTA